MKKCSKCGEVKYFSEFYKRSGVKDGRASECKSCHLAMTKQWDFEHPEKRQEINHKSNISIAHKTRDIERSKKRREYFSKYEKTENGKKIRQNQMELRRARKNQVESTLTSKEWRDVVFSYGNRCVYCNKELLNPTQDHIIPISKGGTHTADNVVPACKSCNSSKQDKGLISWLFGRM